MKQLELIADTETPISLFHKITEDKPGSILLESVINAEKHGRYSFILTEPSETLDNLDDLEKKIQTQKSLQPTGSPIFSGGYVGSINYETVQIFEPSVHIKGLPQVRFDRYDTVIAFDHFMNKILLITHLPNGMNRLKTLAKKIKTQKSTLRAIERSNEGIKMHSDTTQAEFEDSVKQAKQAIVDGEIFQVVLSQCFSAKLKSDPFTLYRALRVINPSPYMFYLNRGDQHIIGASPESLVRVEQNQVTIAPIAGTRQRGANEKEDEAFSHALKTDEKELAEHRMLLDLGRNDIGRVSIPGSIRVDRQERVERYSHVMHLVSDVTGTLKPGKTAFDALKACFPAGTLSGAPKIRAMQWISKLEKTPRDIYGGGIGYFDFSGNMDLAIAIRTFMVEKGIAKLQVGAGIVHDSDPTQEYHETLHKAQANFKALTLRTA